LKSSPPDDLAAALAHASGRLGIFARKVHWYAEARSTNDIATALAEQGACEGTIVIAEAQTAGRGRYGRAWCSPAGAGLYVSAVLRPRQRAVPLMTIAAGVALADGIRMATGLTAALKWPNDVMVPPAKLAGILAEASGTHVVVGFGLNVRATSYPSDVAARATSLERELGRPVEPLAVLVECLAALAARYDDVEHERFDVILEAWRSYARPTLDRLVEYDGRDGVRRGVAEDIDESGALLVRTDDATVRVISGEVRWI
jgi:BirA family biotin operon repressor/biotin-[acetyl-CoA-carboxylase] ligase